MNCVLIRIILLFEMNYYFEDILNFIDYYPDISLKDAKVSLVVLKSSGNFIVCYSRSVYIDGFRVVFLKKPASCLCEQTGHDKQSLSWELLQ